MSKKAKKKLSDPADTSVGLHVEESILRAKFTELHSIMMEAAKTNPLAMELYVDAAATMAWNVYFFQQNYPDQIKKIGSNRMDWPVIITHQKKWFEEMYGCKLFDTQDAVYGLSKYIHLASSYKYNINAVKYDSVAEVLFSILINRKHRPFRTKLESIVGNFTSDKAKDIRNEIIAYLPTYFDFDEWWEAEDFNDIVKGDIPAQKRRKIKQSLLRKLQSILPDK